MSNNQTIWEDQGTTPLEDLSEARRLHEPCTFGKIPRNSRPLITRIVGGKAVVIEMTQEEFDIEAAKLLRAMETG